MIGGSAGAQERADGQARPLVSVIIPVKNGMPLLGRVLAAVMKQKFPAGFEVIVIDSGSVDGSLEAVPADDPRFRLVRISADSFGHGRTRNLGVELARGAFCAFLTHDATPADENWLSELVRPMLEDPLVAGVFGRHIAYENASPYTRWELEVHFAGFRATPVVAMDDPPGYASDVGVRQFAHFYSDNSSCLRRSVWLEHPYPDVDFAEDQLWAKSIVEAGYRKAFAWNSVVYHSHDHSPLDRLRRSFDEARAFQELFGYRLCARKRDVLWQTFRTTGRDILLAIRHGWIVRYPLAVLGRPFDNLARQLGYYLGGSRAGLGSRAVGALSRDKRLRMS